MGNSAIQKICSGNDLGERQIQPNQPHIPDQFQCQQDYQTDLDIERPLSEAFKDLNFVKIKKTKSSKFLKLSNNFFTSKMVQSDTSNIKDSNQTSVVMSETGDNDITFNDLFGSMTSVERHGSINTSVKDYVTFRKCHVQKYYTKRKILSQKKNNAIFEVIRKDNGQKRALKEINKPTRKRFADSNTKLTIQELKVKGQCEIAPTLDHSNIMRIYEIYELGTKIVIVMEHFETNLENYILKFDENDQLKNQEYEDYIKIIFYQILRALNYLHEQNISHSNISSKTIMLVKKNNKKPEEIIAKLISFGSSSSDVKENYPYVPMKNSNEDELAEFQAPEIQKNQQKNLKTDIWDLGILLFRSITRFNPNISLREHAKSYEGLAKYIRSCWKELEEKYDLSQYCLELILKMLEINYDERWDARECLGHQWFDTECLNDPQDAVGGSNGVVELLMKNGKYNTFINLVKNILIYKNVSQRDLHKYSQIFHEVDKDHSGVIHIQQLINHFEHSDMFDDKKTLKEACFDIIEIVDNDASGCLDFHEFIHNICNIHIYLTKQNLSEVFDHLDRDGNGSICLLELQEIFDGCDFEELSKYLEKIDVDNDGYINKEEFIQYCYFKMGK